MFLKLLTVIILATAIGAALLRLRHQQLLIVHDCALLTRKMDQCRQAMWYLQVQIAVETEPQRLRQAITRAQLDMVPATLASDTNPVPGQLARRTP